MSKRAAADVTASAKKLKPSAITSFFKKDDEISSSTHKAQSATTPQAPFDKQSWLNGLDASKRELLNLEINTLHDSWLSALHQELTKPYFIKLKDFIKKERSKSQVFPPEKDVYSWSRHTPLDTVKVVIVGQDPYHNVGQAHGLCFSVQAPTPAPPSLKNMYKALKKDYPSFKEPRHGSLLAWADQGVLLLNTCLTVRAHEANSHQKQGWEQFTQKVLDVVATQRDKGVVFMAWGRPAQERVKKLDTNKHLRLESVHPSPLSAARGFFDCGHFLKANDWLTQRYSIEGIIDWDCLAEHSNGLTKSPTEMKPEESFGVSQEEEALMAEAQSELEQTDIPASKVEKVANELDSEIVQVEKSTRNTEDAIEEIKEKIDHVH